VPATVEGFNASHGLNDAGAGGLIWTPECLVPWLHKPRDVVPTTKMSFAGLADQADIDNVIAYLATFSPDFAPGAPSPEASASSAPVN
jgi:cytochrome c